MEDKSGVETSVRCNNKEISTEVGEESILEGLSVLASPEH